MIYGFETCGQTKLFRPKRFHSGLTAHLQKSEIATTYLEEKDKICYFCDFLRKCIEFLYRKN